MTRLHSKQLSFLSPKKLLFTPPKSSQLKPPFFLSFILAFLIILASIVFFLIAPPQIPLWYSRPPGISQLTQRIFIFIFPVLGLFITFINSFVATTLIRQELLLKRIVLWSAVIFNLLLLITLLNLIFIFI